MPFMERQASSLPVWAASLPLKCSAGKDARRTGSQDGCPTTARFMGRHCSIRHPYRCGAQDVGGVVDAPCASLLLRTP